MYIDDAERLRRNGVVRLLLAQLEGRHPGATEHAARVAVYSVSTANELVSDVDELLAIRYASELHEFGSELPETIKEWEFLHGCMVIGSSLKEQWNGFGSPLGLAGYRIPLGARVIAVADAFDRLTMPIGGEGTVSEPVALADIQQGSGRKYDPAVVKAFLRIQRIVQPVGL
jgi:response regulator RpfG family c-di-GMP phosphodiesterase